MHLNKNFLISLCLTLFVVTTAFSQSILWKVTGKNLQAPSYLYGTIHIQDEQVFAFDSTVWNALYSCDAFAMEVLLDEVSMGSISKSMLMPKGKVLSEMLSKEDFALLDSLCKVKLGVSVIFMNRMKPFFIGTTLQQVDLPKDTETALDLFLLKKAREAGKHCYGVEDYMDQIKAIDAMGMKDQLKMLHTILHDTSNTTSEEFDTLLEAYLAFNLDKLGQLTQDTALPKKFSKVLIDDRNVTMAKRFVEIAKQQTLFCAVGAGHLGGKKGVIGLLRKKGYTVEPVMFQWKTK